VKVYTHHDPQYQWGKNPDWGGHKGLPVPIKARLIYSSLFFQTISACDKTYHGDGPFETEGIAFIIKNTILPDRLHVENGPNFGLNPPEGAPVIQINWDKPH
jgi:hypothetical protein